MKLHQLRYLCEVIDSGLNVSRASARLHTSPSGISKQLRTLEDELGVELLTRRKTRITGITPSGEAALPVIRRILNDVDQVRHIGKRGASGNSGVLRIATTHTHACYGLVGALKLYAQRWPAVAVHLRQGTPGQIGAWVASGTVDLGIGTAPIASNAALQQAPCYELAHSVVVPAMHPLLTEKRLTLRAIAHHPLVLNGETSRLGRLVEDTFAAQGIGCTVAIRAMDTTAMKKFVELGFGVAVLPSITVDARREPHLKAIPVGHLFRRGKVSVITLKDQPLTEYGEAFVRLVREHGGTRGETTRGGRVRALTPP
ncbi:MAG TPA: LysR substrate-binding domain-containing protein [Burkholderiales bacterium]